MRALTTTALVILAAIPGAGCAAEQSCGVTSTVADYTPECAAALVIWPEEARLIVDDRLVAYLPPDVQPETVYGGTTGRPITVLLDDRLAEVRPTAVTFLGSLEEVRVDAVFADGEVYGTVSAAVERSEGR